MNITNTPIQTPTEEQIAWLLSTYHYHPSEGVAIFACAAFGLLTLLIAALTLKYKGYYMWIVVGASLLESVGYGIRIATLHSTQLRLYIVSVLLLVVMPIALVFVNYFVMGRILKKYGRKLMIINPDSIARTWLISDVATFLLQGAATVLLTSNNAQKIKTGRRIIITGFVVQLIFFAAFLYITLHAAVVSPRFKLFRVKSLRMIFIGLWTTTICFFIRNIYRATDFISATTSYVPTHEWLFYVFDFAPIALSIIFYSIFHFGRFLDGPWVEELKAHKREIVGGDEDGDLELEDKVIPPVPVSAV
mgnify:CR=1 FL=1